MSASPSLHLSRERLFPTDPAARELCDALYQRAKDFPIISPHGHTDPRWFAEDAAFANALDLLVVPDHYLLRMLFSQGVSLANVGVPDREGRVTTTPREGWRVFAKHYYLFAGTPSRMWLDSTFKDVLGIEVRLDEQSADDYFDHINDCLARPEFRPRALLDRFNVDFIATTEHALDNLHYHQMLTQEGLSKRITTTFRPDDVLDPDHGNFAASIEQLGELTGTAVTTFASYLNALRDRRAFFRSVGAMATDHGPATPFTADLDAGESARLFDRCLRGEADEAQRALFRGHMLTEMARMSLEDGMTMQIHPGSHRNHNGQLLATYGRDKGADIPMRVSYTDALQPLLNAVGNETQLELIVFTLDETNYARELAPLAGHYPALRLGPPWWFHDSPEGMLRFRRSVNETAGFYNTAGFNDDTRALLSIPARHDMARRVDCRFLAESVVEGRLSEHDAMELVEVLTSGLVKQAYGLH